MARTKIIKEVSPFLQQFYVELIRDTYSAKRQRDAMAYKDALQHLIITLPDDVVNEAIARINKTLKNLGIHFDTFEDAIEGTEAYCQEVIKRYGIPMYKKIEVCNKESIKFYDALMTALMKTIHDKGIFITLKVVQVGEFK